MFPEGIPVGCLDSKHKLKDFLFLVNEMKNSKAKSQNSKVRMKKKKEFDIDIMKRLDNLIVETKRELFFVNIYNKSVDKFVQLSKDNKFKYNPDELKDKAVIEVLKEMGIDDKFDDNDIAEYIKNKHKELWEKEIIAKEINIICKEIIETDIRSQSVNSYLKEKLDNIWERYKTSNKRTAFGYKKKIFAKKFFWEYGIKLIGRYKNFESFYTNIFLK